MEVKLDNIFPAIQIHLSIKGDNCIVGEGMKERVERAIRIPGSGFVAAEIYPHRVIVTSTTPREKADELATAMMNAIEDEFNKKPEKKAKK